MSGYGPQDSSEPQDVMADEHLGRPLLVRWIDSGLALNGWTSQHDIPKTVSSVESVGLWIGENDEVMMIAGTRDEENCNWLNVQLIWKKAVTGKEWL